MPEEKKDEFDKEVAGIKRRKFIIIGALVAMCLVMFILGYSTSQYYMAKQISEGFSAAVHYCEDKGEYFVMLSGEKEGDFIPGCLNPLNWSVGS